MILSDEYISRIRHDVFAYYKTSARNFPRRQTTNPYHIFVSERMLQQTQASRVISKYLAFIDFFPDIYHLAHASISDVIAHRSGLGFNRRALMIRHAAHHILTHWGGEIPNDPIRLKTISGIGEYTAHSIPIFAYNRDDVTIDINIKRVFAYFVGYVPEKKILRSRALQCLPLGQSRDRHNALMDFGSGVATAKITGITAAKQKPFNGSNRQVRGKILKILTKQGSIGLSELFTLFPTNPVKNIVDDLVREGFIIIREGILHLA